MNLEKKRKVDEFNKAYEESKTPRSIALTERIRLREEKEKQDRINRFLGISQDSSGV